MYALRRAAATVRRKTCSTIQKCNAHSLPALPYKYNALEPVICGEIMELHHQKHHATYIANLNAAEENLQAAIAKGDLNTIISLQPALKFNGGGHINHSIFWNNLSPCGGQPSEDIMRAICASFGSMDDMKNKMMTMTNAIQGSGWGWLGVNPETKKLHLATCANQDPLRATTGLIPLFGIDVWEHAYYLQYKNARAEYTKKIFDILNWDDINKRFCMACQ